MLAAGEGRLGDLVTISWRLKLRPCSRLLAEGAAAHRERDTVSHQRATNRPHTATLKPALGEYLGQPRGPASGPARRTPSPFGSGARATSWSPRRSPTGLPTCRGADVNQR